MQLRMSQIESVSERNSEMVVFISVVWRWGREMDACLMSRVHQVTMQVSWKQ